MKRNVGILIFENAEVLDFSGPFEVFAVTSQLNDYQPFSVFTVAKEAGPVRAVNGMIVLPNYSFADTPHIDILVISGGYGTRKLLDDELTLKWVKKIHESVEITMSICTGAGILAKLGVLKHKHYCTHQSVYDLVQEMEPNAIPEKDKRFIRSADNIFTSGGISAGIDLSFHVVETLLGKQTACETAEYMEYKYENY